MKKRSLILLMSLYLIPAIGFSVKAHYCGGKLSSVSLAFLDIKECACGSKKMKKNCCKTKICIFKIQDAQKHTPEFTFDYNNFEIQPELTTVSEFMFQPIKVEPSVYFKKYPPDEIEQALYLLNKVFRI